MYHSLTFSTTPDDNETGSLVGPNTWTDWHLIPASRPTMSFPKPSSNMIEIPGRDGTYDMSTYLTGTVTYGDRTGSFEFIVDNGHENWITIYRKIATYLHGKKLYMCLADDDPGYYYEGRFSVNSWKSDPANSKIVIDYQVGPYKFAVRKHGVQMTVWNTFNFETDDDWDMLSDVTVDGPRDITIVGYDYPFKLFMTVTSVDEGSSVTATFRGVTRTFTEAESGYIFPIPAARGDNVLSLSGNGVANFWFQTGSF